MSNTIVYHNFAVERRQSPLSTISNDDADEVDIRQYANVLYENRWMMTAVIIVALLCSALYVMAVRPVYEANFLIHVEDEGDKKPNTTFTEMGAMFNVKTTANAEVELVKSRLVISRALEKLNIYVTYGPDYFPIVGKWLAMKNWKLPVSPGFGGFAWHNEHLQVASFTLPDVLLNQEFKITAGENGNFILEDQKGTVTANGKVGVPLKIDHPSGPIELLISELQATPGVHFRLQRSSRLAMIERIQASLSAVEQGKQSAVINVVLRGNDPVWISAVLGEIAKEYLSQNAARKTQEARNALAFLNKQLPELKQQLEESETKYNQYRNSKGTIDLPEEAKSDLQQLALAKTRKVDLEQKRTELLIRFTPNHPVLEGLDTQLRDVNTEIKKLGGHIKSLPLMEQELLKLSRDVKINTDLYTSLLNTARQLRLVTVSATTNVRLVDMPVVPEKSISFSPSKIFGIGLFGGLLAGISAAFARKYLGNRVENSVEVEQAVNLPVYSVIPHSRMQQKLQARNGAKGDRIPLLAKDAPLDEAIESLRNFRAVLQYSASQLENNIMLIVSPTAGNGKSFISANLAAVMGSGNKRMLLIDADLRNGDLHQYFGVGQSLGLAEALAGMASVDTVIRHTVMPNVDFISSGAMRSDSELLMQPRLGELLRSLAQRYDMVLLNGAPLLEVSDSLVIGAHAGAVYIVVHAGVTTSREIGEAVKILRQAGLSAKGCLLNGVKMRPKPTTSYYRNKYAKHWRTQYALKRLPVTDVTDVTAKMRQG